MADPDTELRRVWGGDGGVVLALPAFLPSVVISFLPNNKGGGGSAGSLDLSPRSTTENDCFAV